MMLFFKFMLLFAAPAAADEFITIPDPGLRAYLLEIADENGDGRLSTTEAQRVQDVVCTRRNIRDLSGIHHFTGLMMLDCSFNQLTRLPDLSALKALEYLRVDHNQLIELPELNELPRLRWLYVFNNQLVSLPKLDRLHHLTRIIALNNQLEDLPDLSKLKRLEWLFLENNNLTTLPDIQPLQELKELVAYGNPLTLDQCTLVQKAQDRQIKLVLNPLKGGGVLDCQAQPPLIRLPPPKPKPKLNMVGRVVTTLRASLDMVLEYLAKQDPI